MEQKRSHATGNVMSLLTSAHTQQLLLFTTRVHGMLRQSICALASSYFSESSSAQDRKFERSIENRFCRCGADRTKREAKINASNATQNSNCSFTMKTTLTLLVVLCIDRTQAARETVACHDDASCEDKIIQKDSNLAITTNFNYFVHRCSQGAMSPKFLAYFVILCFETRCPKQNTIVRLKLKHLASKILGWLRYWFCPSVVWILFQKIKTVAFWVWTFDLT